VTAVFTGHDHIYARMNDGSHVVYVVSGGAGASLSSVGGTSKATTAASASAFNFVVLHVVGRSVSATAYDDGGNTLDQWTAESTNSASAPPDAGVDGNGNGNGDGTPTGPAPSGAHHGCSFAGSASPLTGSWLLFAFAAACLLRRLLL
jgi:hypothetical protein